MLQQELIQLILHEFFSRFHTDTKEHTVQVQADQFCALVNLSKQY